MNDRMVSLSVRIRRSMRLDLDRLVANLALQRRKKVTLTDVVEEALQDKLRKEKQ
jgi:hypothetical protein